MSLFVVVIVYLCAFDAFFNKKNPFCFEYVKLKMFKAVGKKSINKLINFGITNLKTSWNEQPKSCSHRQHKMRLRIKSSVTETL